MIEPSCFRCGQEDLCSDGREAHRLGWHDDGFYTWFGRGGWLCPRCWYSTERSISLYLRLTGIRLATNGSIVTRQELDRFSCRELIATVRSTRGSES